MVSKLEKIMKNKSLIYLLFPIAVFIIYWYDFISITNHLDTIFDEGYFYLLLWKVRHGIINEGISQWSLIVHGILGDGICSNIIKLRYSGFACNFLSVAFFSCISGWYLFKKKILDSTIKIILFFSVAFLLGSFHQVGVIIAYNNLQNFFLLMVISCFLYATHIHSNKAAFLYLLIGFFSFLSILTILPSGILMLISVTALLWIKYIRNKRKALSFTFCIVSGMFLSALTFHLFIYDIRDVIGNMSKTTNIITASNGWFHISSYFINISMYFRDFYMTMSLLSGMFFVCLFIRKFTKDWIAKTIFTISLFVFYIFQKKPELPITTLLVFILFLFFVGILNETKKIIFRDILSFPVLIQLFLFFSPLIASIGTNIYLGDKIACFIVPWTCLFLELISNPLIKDKYSKEIHFLIWVFLLLFITQPIESIINSFNNKSKAVYYFHKEKPIAQIPLTKNQKNYFDRVYQIMNKYGYESRKDVVFATQLDHMTICAFDGIPCGTYFWPIDFLLDPNKKRLDKPVFLFLDTYDLSMLSDTFRTLRWGFPQNYDRYFVGTPESILTSYSTERWLYCAKDRRISTIR